MTEQSETVEQGSDETAEERNHLSDIEAGAGCTEIWEHLSEQRDAAQD
jgi:hypothetical protein